MPQYPCTEPGPREPSLQHREYLGHNFLAIFPLHSEACRRQQKVGHEQFQKHLASKVRHPPIVAPVTRAAPSKRFVLRPTYLSGPGILFAFEFGWRAVPEGGIVRLRRRSGRRLSTCVGKGRLRGGGDFNRSFDSRTLESFEFGLLFCGKSRRGGGGLECRGGSGDGRERHGASLSDGLDELAMPLTDGPETREDAALKTGH